MLAEPIIRCWMELKVRPIDAMKSSASLSDGLAWASADILLQVPAAR